MRYSIDTCALIDAWEKYFAPDFAPGFWVHVEDLVEDGTLRATAEVRKEIKKSPDLKKWLAARDDLYINLDEDVLIVAAEILEEHPGLVKQGRRGADPFVIALAEVHDAAVISQEAPRRDKIPTVCAARGVECIEIFELLRREGLTLRA